jgi:AraC-like DNA-binding protein
MRPAASEEILTAAPAGRTFAGRHFLVWCWSPTLAGTVFWGRPDLADLQLAMRLWEMDAQLERYSSVVDLSRVEAIDAAPFEHALGHLQRRGAWYAARVSRGAVVPPQTSVLPAVVIAGMWRIAAPGHPWSEQPDAARAFTWLGHPDGDAAHREVEAMIATAMATSPLLEMLRRHLQGRLATASLISAARALQVSERTLQRTLRAAGTSFSAEVDRARVDAAKLRLRDDDAKIESVARAVGCVSASHLARVFRRVTGTTPGAYRVERPSASEMPDKSRLRVSPAAAIDRTMRG